MHQPLLDEPCVFGRRNHQKQFETGRFAPREAKIGTTTLRNRHLPVRIAVAYETGAANELAPALSLRNPKQGTRGSHQIVLPDFSTCEQRRVENPANDILARVSLIRSHRIWREDY
jgi:hypothetical protein